MSEIIHLQLLMRIVSCRGSRGGSRSNGLSSGSDSLSISGRSGRLGHSEAVLRVVLDELDERLERAVTLVLDKLLGTSGLELESREASDLEASRLGEVVGGGVHLENGELVLVASKVFTELVPDGGELLAVAAPWGIELGKNILGVVKDNLIKLASDQGEDGAVVGLGDGVRLEHGLERASDERVDET